MKKTLPAAVALFALLMMPLALPAQETGTAVKTPAPQSLDEFLASLKAPEENGSGLIPEPSQMCQPCSGDGDCGMHICVGYCDFRFGLSGCCAC